MNGDVLVRDGSFLIAGASGDVTGAGLDGLFVADTRLLSYWLLTIDGERPLLLSGARQDSSATAVLCAPSRRNQLPGYEAVRSQAVTVSGLAEELRLISHLDEPATIEVRYLVVADFADQFELRGDRSFPRTVRREAVIEPDGLRLRYQRDWFQRQSRIRAVPQPSVVIAEPAGGHVLVWRVDLPAGGEWTLRTTVHGDEPAASPATAPGPRGPRAVAEIAAEAAADVAAFLAPASQVRIDSPDLVRCFRQGLRDLAGLRIPFGGRPLRPVGAGVPWFLSLFGRDSLLTSYAALPYLPDLAADTLRALAQVQGRDHDPRRLEEPGKIVHEVRQGELSQLGDVPYHRYYGTVDATPLFLVVLSEHREVTADDALARELEPAARAAVSWMRHDGGLDQHGYLVYRTDQPGLVHQGWKDSATAICFPGGEPASGPIALCEAQGYAYDALRRCAKLARQVWQDPEYGRQLDALAQQLRERFLTDFWCEPAGYVALALDGARHPVPTITSNPGHLLWSGMLDPDRARLVGQRLLASDMFSGWGIRTLAAGQPAYHPISYHRGGVWPHDTGLVVAGLARYGLVDAAVQVADGLIAAAAWSGGRLPEVITGHDRERYPCPVRYPHANSPQAWAAATPLLLATVLAGTTPESATSAGDGLAQVHPRAPTESALG